MLVLVLVLVLVLLDTAAGGAFRVADQTCGAASYYDIASFSCIACDSTQVATQDGFGCECKAGYIGDLSTSSTTTATPPCTICPYASSANRLFCMTCDSSTTGFDSNTRECGCASQFGLVETDQAGSYNSFKSCTQCTSATYLLDGVCEACYDPRMTSATGECLCTTDYYYTIANDSSCLHRPTAETLLSEYSTATAYVVDYTTFPSAGVISAAGGTAAQVTSGLFEHWIYEVAAKCRRQEGQNWCGMLLNMCVLQLYSGTACSMYEAIYTYYLSFPNQYPLQSTAISYDTYDLSSGKDLGPPRTIYSFHPEGNEQSEMNIVLASYAFNGTFLGWRNLTTELTLCGGDRHVKTFAQLLKFRQYGTFTKISCKIDLNRFIHGDDTVFYDVYLREADGTLQQIPIDFRDSQDQEEYETEYFEPHFKEQSVITRYRRMFIVDNLSGREPDYNSSPTVVRVLAQAAFVIEPACTDECNKIRWMFMVATYSDIDITGLDANTPAMVSTGFYTAYNVETGDYTYGDGFSFLFVTQLLTALAVLGIRAYGYLRANRCKVVDCSFIVDMISILFRSMGNVFGLGFLCLCWFYYTLFKFQGTIINLMPSDYAILDDLYKNFALGFLGVFVGHLFLMFGQTSIDVFMIDWENRHELFRGAETVKAPISTWRVLFVGNQFARLQSARLTNFDFTCFAVLVLLTGLPSMTRNYYSASCITADGDDLDGCSAWAKSDFMRFAIFSFFWIAVEFIQVIYVTYVKQRYWKHPSKQLLDLMSLANISIWIMPDKYAGYYLHGQTALQHADIALPEITQLLDDEAKNISAHRGVLTGEDQQEFYMFVADETRDQYAAYADQIRSAKLQSKESSSCLDSMRQHGSLFPGNQTLKPGSSSLLEAQNNMNDLLKSFVRRMQTEYKDTNFVEPGFQERCMHLPPDQADVAALGHGVFWPDRRQTWTKIMYEGIEYDLLMFNIYVFCMFELISKQPFVAMLLTYLSQKALDYMRHNLAIKNLGTKTLVGERFFL